MYCFKDNRQYDNSIVLLFFSIYTQPSYVALHQKTKKIVEISIKLDRVAPLIAEASLLLVSSKYT